MMPDFGRHGALASDPTVIYHISISPTCSIRRPTLFTAGKRAVVRANVGPTPWCSSISSIIVVVIIMSTHHQQRPPQQQQQRALQWSRLRGIILRINAVSRPGEARRWRPQNSDATPNTTAPG